LNTATPLKEATVKPAKPTFKKVSVSEVFPEVYPENGPEIKVFNERSSRCVNSNKNYVPDETLVRLWLAWQQAQEQPLCFGLNGHTGTGKTEFLYWVADRMNIPVYLLQCTPALTPEDIEGVMTLKNGETSFQLGAILQAYKNGGLIILDEVDKLNEDATAYLHGVLEGKPVTVSLTGEMIEKNPLCWIAATGNTKGEGGSSLYTSSQQLDGAFRSRIGWIDCQYPDAARELDILIKNYGEKVPKAMLRDSVKMANELRDIAFGTERKGIDNPAGVICSTRTLVNWIYYTIRFGQNVEWRMSLDYVLSGSVDPESSGKVGEAIQRRLGDKPDMKVGKVLELYSSKPSPNN